MTVVGPVIENGTASSRYGTKRYARTPLPSLPVRLALYSFVPRRCWIPILQSVIGIALGGGGARGWALIGALKLLGVNGVTGCTQEFVRLLPGSRG